jgi:hypothetical protein
VAPDRRFAAINVILTRQPLFQHRHWSIARKGIKGGGGSASVYRPNTYGSVAEMLHRSVSAYSAPMYSDTLRLLPLLNSVPSVTRWPV